MASNDLSSEFQQLNMDGSELRVDAVIVGGGFGGCYLLHKLRKQGLSVKLIDALDGLGGVWRGNWYPGARTDTEMPVYLLSAPDIMNSWYWSERYVGSEELRRYFDHVDKVWELSKDAIFNTRVNEAKYDEGARLWRIKTSAGLRLSCRWFLPAVGTTNKKNVPQWPGMSDFKGELYHPAAWPHKEPAEVLKGKRVAVVGAGSSALQIVQEAAKLATNLTQFIRTPIIAYPMQQREITPLECDQIRPLIPMLSKLAKSLPGALPYAPDPRKTKDVSPEEREAHWKDNWRTGGFRNLASAFSDYMVDAEANRLMYDFWREQTIKRIPDPAKREIVAPVEPPYPVNCKRIGVEQDYYEMISLPHVDLTKSPIESFDEKGIITKDGKHHEFDLIVVSTGYDSVTGPLLEMGIVGRDSVPLKEKWADGILTHLGATVNGFPNMLFPYGPQAPTSLTGGTQFVEQQVEWICDMIAKADESRWQSLEPTKEAEEQWRALVLGIVDQTLIPGTDSWWIGANIPGKRREMLVFAGGTVMYFEKCDEALETMKGFEHT